MPGCLARPALPALPADLRGWRWERNESQQRLLCDATGWATPWADDADDAQPTIAIAQRYVRVMERDDMQTAIVFSPALQQLGQRYVEARKRTGQAMLDAAHCMSQARQLAKHGQWTAWLDSVGTSADVAEQLIAIHQRTIANPAFAEKIRDGFLSQSAAGLLARPSTPPEVVAQALAAPEPPTARQIKAAVAETKLRDVPEYTERRITDHALCAALRESISCSQEHIPKGKIRRPVAYDNELWVGTGDAMSERGAVEARRLSPVTDWTKATYSYADKSRMGVYGREFYTGIRVAYGQDHYVLTSDILLVSGTPPARPCYDCGTHEGVLPPSTSLGTHLCQTCKDKRGSATTTGLSATAIAAGWSYKYSAGSWQGWRDGQAQTSWFPKWDEGRAQVIAAIEARLIPSRPELPPDLAGWAWEVDHVKGRYRLNAPPAIGIVTNWWPSPEEVIDDARDLVNLPPAPILALPSDLVAAGWQLHRADDAQLAVAPGQWYAGTDGASTQGYATPEGAVAAAQDIQHQYGAALAPAPIRPIRPVRPRNEDVQIGYLRDLETYADALETYVNALEP